MMALRITTWNGALPLLIICVETMTLTPRLSEWHQVNLSTHSLMRIQMLMVTETLSATSHGEKIGLFR